MVRSRRPRSARRCRPSSSARPAGHARRRRGRRGRPDGPGPRPDGDHHGLGPGGGPGRLPQRPAQRGPPQPGRHPGPGRSGRLPPARVLPYWAAQFPGAFVGAMLVYVDYAEAFRAFEGAERIVRGAMVDGKLAGPAAGGPGSSPTTRPLTAWRNVFSEFLGTAVLLLGVRALTDRRNAAPGGYVEPLALGALVWAIGLSLGGPTGYAINPARDLGPRVASALLGWGPTVFASHGVLLLDPDRRAAGRRAGRDVPLRLRDPPVPAAQGDAEPARRAFALIGSSSRPSPIRGTMSRTGPRCRSRPRTSTPTPSRSGGIPGGRPCRRPRRLPEASTGSGSTPRATPSPRPRRSAGDGWRRSGWRSRDGRHPRRPARFGRGILAGDRRRASRAAPVQGDVLTLARYDPLDAGVVGLLCSSQSPQG